MPIEEVNSRRTREEHSQDSRKAGINSGKARRRKADLRKMAQAVLDGTYKDKDGNEATGEELIIRSLVKNLSMPMGKNWGKAMDLLVQLTGAAQTKEMTEKLKAEAKLAKAKAAEIEAAKSEDIVMTDNFLEALNGTAAEDWNDEETDGGI